MPRPSLRFLVALLATLPLTAASQTFIGNMQADVDARTEGLFWLVDPAFSNAIPVYVNVAYRGGAFESRLMADGNYRLVPTQPPVVEPGSFLGYRGRWILDKYGGVDVATNRVGMLVQRVVSVTATTMGTAYVVQGDGFDVPPLPAAKAPKHALLDGETSAFSAAEATVFDLQGQPVRALRTTTRLPVPGTAAPGRQIYVVATRDRRGLPLLVSTAQFAGVTVHRVASVPPPKP